MSLFFVIIVVLLLGAIATFAPIEGRFKNLLYGLAVVVIIVYLLLLLTGVADVGWPHRTVAVP